MTAQQILLDPVDFMALHLSSLANGGIGEGDSIIDGCPVCQRGHAQWLDGEPGDFIYGPSTPMVDRLERDGLNVETNDLTLGEGRGQVAFEKYIKLLNIDIKEVA